MTDEIASPPVPRPPAPKPWRGWYNERIFLAICAGLIIAGSFGPWITAERTDTIHFARSGMDFDGHLTLVGGALLAVFVFLRIYIGAIVIGALVTLCGVLNHRDLQDGALFDDGTIFLAGGIGLGLYAVLAGGMGALILGILCIRYERRIDWRVLGLHRQREDRSSQW
jgi:hypothetical protein